MKLRGKEYEIDVDIPLYLLFELQKNPTTEIIMKFMKEILIPKPSEEDMREFTLEDFMKVSAEFQKRLQEKTVEIKKKLSL